MKKIYLSILFFLFIHFGFSQFAIGTFSFSNSGGAGFKNVWTNSFNWLQWNGSAFILSGTTPTSANDVIINLDNLLSSGTPTLLGVSSADRLLIDATSSCRTFSVIGTSTNKGIRTGSNITLNVYGDFDLSGAPRCAFDGISYGAGYATINLTGSNVTPFNIKTNQNVIDIYKVIINGNYQLIDDYTQFPLVGGNPNDYYSNFIINASGKFKTNGKRVNAYNYTTYGGSVCDISNSMFNVVGFNINSIPITTGLTEVIYLSDTLGNNGGKNAAFIALLGGITLNVRKISSYQLTQSSMGSQVSSVAAITCKLFELNTSLNLSPSNLYFQGTIIDTFRVNDKAVIHMSDNTFKTIITPGICDKVVAFKSPDNMTPINLTVTSANTLQYTSWSLYHIIGAGNITANNSINLGFNTGSIVINTNTPRVLAWCGSVNNDWNNGLNWRLLSGGGCGVCPPTNKDSVVFDPIYLSGVSCRTVNINASAYCNGINFLYPNVNPIYLNGNGILYNAGGFWIGYPSGLAPNTSLKGTDWTNFTGQFIMNTNRKMVMMASQNVPINKLGNSTGLGYGALSFTGGGQWYFKDDFTSTGGDFRLINGHVKCSKRNLTFIGATIYPQSAKIAKLDMDTCLFKITGSSGYFQVVEYYSNKLFVIGGKSTLLFDGSSYGGSNGSYPFLYATYGTVDTLGVRSVNFWNVKFANTIPYATYSRQHGVGNVFAHKLTLSPTFFSSSYGISAADGYPYLEIDSLDISLCDKYTLEHYTTPNSKAIKINKAIVTSTVCGIYNNIFSDDAILPADIIVPIDFGTSKVLVNNVTINNGSGTLTASNSILQGNTSGWIASVVAGNRFYWNGEGANTNWNNPRNWNYNIPPSIGITDDALNNPSGCVPSPLDSVFFVNNAFPYSATTGTVTLKNADYARTITWSLTDKLPNSIIWKDTIGASLHVYESLLMNDRPTITYSNAYTYFWGTSATNYLKSSSRAFLNNIYFKGTGTYTLLDSLTAYRIYVDLGTFNSNRKNINVVTSFYSYKPTVRSIIIKSSKITTTSGYGYDYLGGYGCWDFNTTNATLVADSSAIWINTSPSTSFWLGASTLRTAGTNTVQYNKVVFYGGVGGQLNSSSDDLFRFKKVDFQAAISLINGNNRIDTLLYAPMSVNELQVGKTQSVDSLRAISNNCQNIVIKSTSSGSYANLCDIGTYKKLTTTFGDVIDVKSNTCSGFVPSNEVFNGAVTNSPGWIISAASLVFGFPSHTYTLNCKTGPAVLSSTNFYAGPTSTYSWSTGSSAPTITTSINGTYSLTVTYKSGCSFSDAIAVNIINSMNGTYSVTPVSCNSYSNGIASFSLTADTSSSHTYQYVWNTPAPSSSSLTLATLTNSYSSLTAGIYTITVTDVTASTVNCKYTQTISVTQPTPLLTGASTNSIACFGVATGSLNSSPTGGNPSYTYSWTNGSSTYSTQNVSSVSSGIYSITVTDTKSCTTTNTVQVLQPATAITSTLSGISNVLCFGASTGSATILGSGGTGTPTYSWNPGSMTTSLVTGLSANNYTVFVKDVNGCTDTKTLSITQPTSGLSISSLTTNSVLCYGTSTGSVNLTAIGGTPSYTTNWSGPSSYTATTTGLTSSIPASAGTYSATITDANGCTTSTIALVTGPIASVSVALTGSVSPTNCTANTGIANVSPGGGTGSGYVYTWINSAGTNTTAIATNTALPLGTTTVTIVDANSCASNSITLNVTSLGAPTVAITTNSILCNGGTGSAIANVTGTAPYSYTWQASTSTTNNSGSLIAGTYTVLVNETSTGCKTIQTYTLSEPTALATAISNIVNVNCFGANNGSASVTATGGTPTYSYSWLPIGGSASTGTNLAQGVYTVTITDNNNCAKTNTVQILGISQDMTIAITDTVKPDCGNIPNGLITVGVTGGTPIYTYLWSNGTTTPSNINISNATYTVTVTDANNCSKQLEITLDCFTALFIPELYSPNGDGKNDKFEIKGIYNYPNNKIMIFNRWGSLVYQKEKYSNEWDGKPNVNTGTGKELLPSGTYYVVFDFGDNGKTKTYNGFVQLEY